MSDTAFLAKNMFGDELYQQRAQKALPILVRQAEAHQTITYSDLAEELGMPNPRNLNYVLGSIGRTIKEIQSPPLEDAPPITMVVVNKNTGIPGDGIDEFIEEVDFRTLPRKKQRAIIFAKLSLVFGYAHWLEVLTHLGLTPFVQQPIDIVHKAQERIAGGESKLHKEFKEYIASHPEVVAVYGNGESANIEYQLPSGDVADVLFKIPGEWTIIEVKSRISDEPDILRGLYQCVKYQALLEAHLVIEGIRADSRVLLALQGAFPKQLVSIRNTLGIEVIDQIKMSD